MKRSIKVDFLKTILFLILGFFLFPKGLFSQDYNSYSGKESGKSQAQLANRRTAVRCLKLAQNYLSAGDAENALSQVEMGILYDPGISDLWYIKAAAKNQKGESRASIIPLVMKSLTEGEWVDYNRDGARILYSDMLCDTGEYDQALAVLNSNPMLFNADAEFIRAKALYRINTEDSISKAREKINSARKIYPDDLRFPHLFFKFEYVISRKFERPSMPSSSEALVKKLSDYFLLKMPEYDKPDAELEIYAAIFAEGERQKRLLQAFSSHGMKHPLYAGIALENGLMNQQEAWDYFFNFADTEISLEMLEDFLPHITEEETIKSVRERLDSYSGIISLDTNFDLEPELFVKYVRGRPKLFTWDQNDDGLLEWSVECDFGAPEYVELAGGALHLTYGTYPSLVRAEFRSDRNPDKPTVFNLLDETFRWSVADIKAHELFKFLFDIDFYIPFPKTPASYIDERQLLAACSSYEIPTSERPGAFIRFSILDGNPVSSDYFEDGRIYAHGIFKNGLPDYRSVDTNDDGIFETTEYFGYDPENRYNTRIVDQSQLMANLFGRPASGSGLFLRMIQIDQDDDTVPDFTEEYLPDEGKITTWDLDGDGVWDVRYKKYSRPDPSEPLLEDSEFYAFSRDEIVTITRENGYPVRVQSGEREYKVSPGAFDNVYWIGEAGSADEEFYLLSQFDSSTEQGIPVLVQKDTKRMFIVRIGENLFAQIRGEFEDIYKDEENQSQEDGSRASEGNNASSSVNAGRDLY